jgi:hypothetical protein
MEALETNFEKPEKDHAVNDVTPAPRTEEEDRVIRLGDSGPYPNPDEWS